MVGDAIIFWVEIGTFGVLFVVLFLMPRLGRWLGRLFEPLRRP